MTLEKAYIVDNPLYDGIVFQSRDDAAAFADAVRLAVDMRRIREVALVPDGEGALRALGELADALAGGTDE